MTKRLKTLSDRHARLAAAVFFYGICSTSMSLGHARDHAESSERLRFLKQATSSSSGEGSSSGSFQSRVDSTFHPSSDAATVSVENEDFETQQKVKAAVEAEEAVPFEEAGKIQPDKVTGKNEELETENSEPEKSEQAKARVDASETAYQEDLKKATQKGPPSAEKSEEESPQGFEKKSGSRGLPPSLANNPFYMGAAGKTFDEDKAVIVSRLVQQGFSQDEAKRIVSDASSPDEVILDLMQEENFTYGDAADLVKTS